MEFRSSSDTDLGAVISWIVNADECLAWAGPGVIFPISIAGLKHQIDHAPENSFCLVDDGRAVAFGQILAKGEGHFHLARVIVAPEARGQGFGLMICRYLIKTSQSLGARLLTLNVYENNLAALGLYRKLGFEPATPPGATQWPSDVIHMKRQVQTLNGGNMRDRREDIIAGLEDNLKHTISFFNALTPQQVDTPVYQDEVLWTGKQVLAHFATIESTMHWLFKDILAGGPGSPPDFDVDRFNLTQVRKLDDCPMQELIDKFTAVRQKTIAIVTKMTDEDLDREGRHAFHGRGKLERFIRWAYEHVDLHLTDVRNALDK